MEEDEDDFYGNNADAEQPPPQHKEADDEYDMDESEEESDSVYMAPFYSYAANNFKDIEIVMATFQPFEEMKTFYNYYRIADHVNIFMGRDEKYMLPPFYRMQSLPYLALYDKKGNYITHFEGNQKVETILNGFQPKDK